MSKGAKCGFRMLNVETYGSGLWHTWFDRDLSVAGRALLREGDRLVHRLVCTPGCSQQGVLHTCLLPDGFLWEPPGMHYYIEPHHIAGNCSGRR